MGCLVALTLASPVVGQQPITEFSVDAASPNSFNIRTRGSTTMHVTFRGVTADFEPAEAVFCQEIDFEPHPTATDPLLLGRGWVPRMSTIYGRPPQRHDQSQRVGTNFIDIVSVPASIVRRAARAGRDGGNSRFFYVRRFRKLTAGPDFYAFVLFRLGSGGARSALSLQEVILLFEDDSVYKRVGSSDALPPFAAQIIHNGSGRLRGRWEVVLPGDEPPTERDLLPEGSLPREERGFQRRYSILDRFDEFASPRGKMTLKGPAGKFPTQTPGLHYILLRIEATRDREGLTTDSNGNEIATGGVAGFRIPILRYVVVPKSSLRAPGTDDPTPWDLSGTGGPVLDGVELQAMASSGPNGRPTLSWQSDRQVGGYRVEVSRGTELILESPLDPQANRYVIPTWVDLKVEPRPRWRLIACDSEGRIVSRTSWKAFDSGSSGP